jgi:site-specific DNA-methyltransferase (adenine-specific)
MSYRNLQGDVIEKLKTLEDASADSAVTDPPYELGFMGKGWDSSGIAYDITVWREVLRVLKPGGHLLAFGGSRTYHRLACAIEDAGFDIRDQIMWVYGSGFPKSRNLDGDWRGWGTALKPSHEPIVVARKPLIGTVAANILAHGTGALNIDGCRIETNGEELTTGAGNIPCRHPDGLPRSRDGEASATSRYQNSGSTNFAALPGPRGGNPPGRWPANLIHDGSDEVVACFPSEAGAAAPVTLRNGDKFRNAFGAFAGNIDEQGSTFHGDTGSAARFFYCAKASREDRNEGCEEFVKKPLLWSSGTRNPGSFQAAGTDRSSRNNHPTVKPTDLMRYLCRLVTPPGGTILDCFMGSGSTGKAALYEGFKFIGIEREAEYCAIAEARMQHVLETDAPLLRMAVQA